MLKYLGIVPEQQTKMIGSLFTLLLAFVFASDLEVDKHHRDPNRHHNWLTSSSSSSSCSHRHHSHHHSHSHHHHHRCTDEDYARAAVSMMNTYQNLLVNGQSNMINMFALPSATAVQNAAYCNDYSCCVETDPLSAFLASYDVYTTNFINQNPEWQVVNLPSIVKTYAVEIDTIPEQAAILYVYQTEWIWKKNWDCTVSLAKVTLTQDSCQGRTGLGPCSLCS